ncbi:hypothetical protein A2U01_0021880, partial [Trifolium medium]|nr:hypothetical protein [Trifolium medium]
MEIQGLDDDEQCFGALETEIFVQEMCRIVWKEVVGPIYRGQLSPSSPSEQSLAQRARLSNILNIAGWSEEASESISPSDELLAQRAPLYQ